MNQQVRHILAMWTPGPLEIIIILIIAVLIFGRRLPEIGRSMGQSLVEFKKGLKEVKDTKEDIENGVKEAVGLDEQQTNSIK